MVLDDRVERRGGWSAGPVHGAVRSGAIVSARGAELERAGGPTGEVVACMRHALCGAGARE